ncbi:Negative regulator of mitotic exit [Tulasnella sp. 419]|nr:Negative regulator of mitotic exit [Tulasnella sp. 419]
MRNSALQGAAFYRAKLFAYEANSTSEASRTKTQLQQLVSEHMAQERKMDELMDSYASHAKLKEQAKDRANDVITRAGFAKKADEKSLTRGKEQISQLEQEVNYLRNNLETKIQEAESDTSRLTDLEITRSQSREEADACRALTIGGLGKLLDSQRDMLVDEDRAARGCAEKLRAMELEASSLRKMLKEACIWVDAAQNELFGIQKAKSLDRG